MNKLFGGLLIAMILGNVMASAALLNQHLAQTSVETVANTNWDG